METKGIERKMYEKILIGTIFETSPIDIPNDSRIERTKDIEQRSNMATATRKEEK